MLGTESIASATSTSAAALSQSGATVPTKAAARVKEAAGELEATFLSMLLKEMRQTLDEENGGLFPGDSGDVQGGLFDLYLGRHLADGGGVGLAATLVRQTQEAAAARKPTNHTTYDAHAPNALSPARDVPSPPGS